MINYSSDLSTSVENNRTQMRRITWNDEAEFSNASILNSMEKFVKAVNEMDETILVPSRLLDLAVGDAGDTVCQKGKSTIKDTMPNTDLYRLYTIVNTLKVELLWSQKSSIEAQDEETEEEETNRRQIIKSGVTNGVSSPSVSPPTPSTITGSEKSVESAAVRLGHTRCPSTTSMQSASSVISSLSSSDSDSDMGVENDSGLESEDQPDRLANQAAENFRRHLRGLHRSIKRMTQAAEYLALRYQADVGGPV
ncbi:mid1-interacting protein 1 [Cotesia glomerata]|nr:mid1-interacting protein 1 [Cotesia glomerata]